MCSEGTRKENLEYDHDGYYYDYSYDYCPTGVRVAPQHYAAMDQEFHAKVAEPACSEVPPRLYYLQEPREARRFTMLSEQDDKVCYGYWSLIAYREEE